MTTTPCRTTSREHTETRRHRRGLAAASGVTAAVLLITGCGAGAAPPGGATAPTAQAGAVTVTNCDAAATFPSPTQRMFVNDGNLIALALAVGAADQIAAVSSLQRDQDVLTRKYGDVVATLNQVAPEYPSLETVLAARPDVMVAGWNYGYNESSGLTPDVLATHDVAAYVLSESCRQPGGGRGIMDPWEAVRTDLTNLGAITGHPDQAAQVVADTDRRLDALTNAPQAATAPEVFVFDSGTDAIFTSGAFGGPQAIIEAAGGINTMSDVQDTWTQVGWERLAAADPDMIVFVDYPGQTFEDKKEVLAANPASRDLAAVREQRYLNLPYAMWTSGPLNIDAAEHLRQALERYGLQPASGVTPALDLD